MKTIFSALKIKSPQIAIFEQIFFPLYIFAKPDVEDSFGTGPLKVLFINRDFVNTGFNFLASTYPPPCCGR